MLTQCPRVDDLLDQVGQAQFISALDLTKGHWQVPVDKTALQKLREGTTGSILGYAELADPLTDLTRKNAPNHMQWTEECDGAFNRLKQFLCCEPILRCSLPFVLQTDVYGRAIVAVLSQVGGDSEEYT
ncbi:hypothetical protein EMCRGX_G009507 [Ephydatia muelleri]